MKRADREEVRKQLRMKFVGATLKALSFDEILDLVNFSTMEIGDLRADLAKAQERVKELEQEAEATLAYYAEKGRVVVAFDGNAVQRLGASAEIAISKLEQERDQLKRERL